MCLHPVARIVVARARHIATETHEPPPLRHSCLAVAGDILAIAIWTCLLPLVIAAAVAGFGLPRVLPRLWGRLVMLAHGFRLTVEGPVLDSLHRPAVYISNHQSKVRRARSTQSTSYLLVRRCNRTGI